MQKIIEIVSAFSSADLESSGVRSQFSSTDSVDTIGEDLRVVQHIYCLSSRFSSSLRKDEITDFLETVSKLEPSRIDESYIKTVITSEEPIDHKKLDICSVYSFFCKLIITLRKIHISGNRDIFRAEMATRKIARCIFLIRSGFPKLFERDVKNSIENLEVVKLRLQDINKSVDIIPCPVVSILLDSSLGHHWRTFFSNPMKGTGLKFLHFFIDESKEVKKPEMIIFMCLGSVLEDDLTFYNNGVIYSWLRSTIYPKGKRLTKERQISLLALPYHSCHNKEIAMELKVDLSLWCRLINDNCDSLIIIFIYFVLKFEFSFWEQVRKGKSDVSLDPEEIHPNFHNSCITSEMKNFLLEVYNKKEDLGERNNTLSESQGQKIHELTNCDYWDRLFSRVKELNKEFVNLIKSLENEDDETKFDKTSNAYSNFYSNMLKELGDIIPKNCNSYFNPITYFDYSVKDILESSRMDSEYPKKNFFDWCYLR